MILTQSSLLDIPHYISLQIGKGQISKQSHKEPLTFLQNIKTIQSGMAELIFLRKIAFKNSPFLLGCLRNVPIIVKKSTYKKSSYKDFLKNRMI